MEKIFKIIDDMGMLSFPSMEKFRLLNKIKAIANSGQEEKKAIDNKILEYKKRKKFGLVYLLKKVKKETDSGKKLIQALYSAKIIDAGEYYVLKNTKGSIAIGIDKIIENYGKRNASIAGFALMLIPPGLLLIVLLGTHSIVNEVLTNMMKPIVSAGGTPPPLPDYLVDNSVYMLGNIMFFGLLIFVFVLMKIIKNYYPKKYMATFPIIQEEYMLDLLKSIQNVSKGGGMNISNTAKALSLGQSNNVKKLILDEIVENTKNGKVYISRILDDYSVNYGICSNLSIGEDSGDINKGLEIAIAELEDEYNKDISRFLKAGMWIGQISMIGIAMKPMIDIMLLVSIGPLNFTL